MGNVEQHMGVALGTVSRGAQPIRRCSESPSMLTPGAAARDSYFLADGFANIVSTMEPLISSLGLTRSAIGSAA